MAEITTQKQVSSSSAYKVAGLLLAIVVIVLLGWLFLGDTLDDGDNSGKPPVTHGQNDSLPDQAKEQGGNNGDTAPSPNGTGTGSSDNSLLGQ